MQQMQVGAWSFKVSSEEKIFGPKCIVQALDCLDKWQNFFLYEDTWVQKEFAIPSILVRLDCVANGDVLSIFEIEERPSVGVAIRVNSQFAAKLKELMAKWPKFSSVVSTARDSHDDPVWIRTLSLEEAIANSDLLLIRAEPEEKEFHELVHRSVSTVASKGYKGYGPALGLWQPVRLADFESLPWSEGFCLKPMQGSKTQHVEIWHPSKNQYSKHGISGISTRTKIWRTLECQGNMYCQPLIHPLEMYLENKRLMFAHRVYFGYNPETKAYEYLGGVWNARPNMMIHGASDAIFGPVN